MEKDNPDIFDYDIPQALRDIYAAGGHDDQPVCFLATNHTSGGNSGSPVINADGNLIGINFDRVWEGTMSDLAFDPDYCRNISLDIRYLLFVVKEIGHADWLFDEMVFADQAGRKYLQKGPADIGRTFFVEIRGFEPLTYRLRTYRSTN